MSNCAIWAIGRWWRHGGYIVARRSRFGWWPHLLWSLDLRTFYDFVPEGKKRRLLIPPVLFRGVVRQWTPPEQG